MIKLRLLLILYVLLYLLYGCSPVFGESENSFSLGIYPPLLEINALSPSDVNAKLTIQNKTTARISLNILIKPFRQSKSGDGQIEFLPANTFQGKDASIFDKIKIYDKENQIQTLSLDAFESKDINLRVEIPDGEPPSDYYFSVLFVSKSGNGVKSFSSVSGGIGTNVILSINQKGGTSGFIDQFSAPFIHLFGPVPLVLSVHNSSDHYIRPTGRIAITDMFGRSAGLINILPQYILSNSSRYMLESVNNSDNNAKNKILWKDKFSFGFYTATAVVKLSENGALISKKIGFILLPPYLLFSLFVFIFIIVGIYLRVKRKI